MTGDMNSPCKQATGPEMMLQSSTQPQSIVGPSVERLMENSVQYLKDVRDYFSNAPNKYDEFLQVMKEYKDQSILTADLIVRIMEFFEGNRYLALGFNKFLPKGYHIAFDEESHPEKPVQIIEDRDRHSDRKRTVTDRECGSERAVDLDTSRWSTRNMSSYSSGEDEYISQPIRELDVSTWERCTPSYCLLPKDYQIPVASQEGETGAEVLNNQCVLASYGSGDAHKNKNEKVMFNCENDRYELDMLLAHAASATKRVEELLKKIADNLVEVDNTFHINDHLTVTDRKCIKRIYGEYGPAILDALEEDAPLALPMILSRLKQKQEEWAHACIEYNKVWAGVYATYHQKLLNCKQQDAKSLTAKGEQKRSIN